MVKLLLIARFIILVSILEISSCQEDELVFIPCLKSLPALTTCPPEEVTTSSAVLGGTFSSIGFRIPLKAGIYIYQLMDFQGEQISIVPGNEEKKYSELICDGKFRVFMNGLQPGTVYCYLAFIETESGVFYGDQKIVVSSSGTVDDIDGNSYQSVRIGDQVWLRENLRSKSYPDGTFIEGFAESAGDYFSGIHYRWQAATKPDFNLAPDKDAYPAGWHVPSDDEWQKLLTYIGIPAGQLSNFGLIGNNQASMLKDSGSDSWKYEDNNNLTGFTVLPEEIYTLKGECTGLSAAFWTSTPNIFYGFRKGTGKIFRGNDVSGSMYLSIRCIKTGE